VFLLSLSLSRSRTKIFFIPFHFEPCIFDIEGQRAKEWSESERIASSRARGAKIKRGSGKITAASE